jgi:hypothetical protein
VPGADHPVDLRFRICAAEGHGHGDGMDDVAESAEADKEQVHVSRLQPDRFSAYAAIFAISSRVLWFFGSPTMAVRPP